MTLLSSLPLVFPNRICWTLGEAAAFSGLRIGELCALQWKDIDFDNKLLRVRQTVQRIYRKQLNGTGRSKVVIAAPKSRTSARDIPLAPILLPVLERLRQEDAEAYFIGGRMKCSEVPRIGNSTTAFSRETT